MADGTKYCAWGATTAKTGGVKSGTMAGPMVFFSESGQASSGLVLTPITHAMEMNLRWDNASGTLSAGVLGSVESIPANYTTETMLFRGPSDAAACWPRPVGAGCAVHNWGVTLRKYKGKDTGFPAGGWDVDKTLSHLGYYSDNGNKSPLFQLRIARELLLVFANHVLTSVARRCILLLLHH